MDGLHYKITTWNRRKHHVYIERDVCHIFRTKTEAKRYIEHHKKTTHDNVLMLHSIKNQLDNVATVFYPFFNTKTKDDIRECSERFRTAFDMIYHNFGGSEKTTVQFNKIRVSFDCLEDMLSVMKRYAQRNKVGYMLAQLEPIEKFFHLVVKSYNEDIQKLYVHNPLPKGRLIPLNETNDNEKYLSISTRAKEAK